MTAPQPLTDDELAAVKARSEVTRRMLRSRSVESDKDVMRLVAEVERLRAKVEDVRRETFAEVAAGLNEAVGIWERDGGDPCRVRITREYANAHRAYAEGYGEPCGHKKRLAALGEP